ncbi:aldo/keto reductase [Chondromyces crocatus]|uniref:Oxidoreductase n=1 Tax=Chondromyces crocatus TaxID=52 RepID=A0A0K1EPF7_CHOCO|nr:aldo/keto reductase [Chondromyces crocatus]AKT42503.1 oxidoreductase [Chondromyces crocatus]
MNDKRTDDTERREHAAQKAQNAAHLDRRTFLSAMGLASLAGTLPTLGCTPQATTGNEPPRSSASLQPEPPPPSAGAKANENTMQNIDVGPIVLGGNVFGWTVERDDAFRILDAFVDKGGRAIDTADVYPAWAEGRKGGESEQMIGEWLAARGHRSKLVIATKVAKWKERPGLSPANIRTAIEGSLRRLQTDHVDIYYAHEDDQNVQQAEYLDAFDRLVKEGKVRALGASNFTPERLASALALSRANGLRPFQFSQDHWNLVERGIEKTLVPLLQKEGLKELPYWSLASGFLTGKYRPGQKVDSMRAGSAGKYLTDPKNVTLLGALDEISAAHKTSVAAVALAWLHAQPVVAAPLASARTIEQLGPLFDAASLRLTAEEVSKLSAITAP